MTTTKGKGSSRRTADTIGENNRSNLHSAIENKIADYITENFESFIADIDELDVKERVKIKADLIKLIVPRAVADDSAETPATPSPLIAKLFAKNSIESEQ